MRFKGRRATLLGLAAVSAGALVNLVRPAHGIARASARFSAPRNTTMRVAEELVSGRCSALFHLAAFRERPAAKEVLDLGHYKSLIERTSFDPLLDVERAFVTSSSLADTAGSALVLELGEQVAGSLERELRRVGDPLRASGDALTVLTELDGTPYAVRAIGASTLASIPWAKGPDLSRFDGCLGLPRAAAQEAFTVTAVDPAATFSAIGPLPVTLSDLVLNISFADWGATVDMSATSTSDEQAKRDAASLTELVNRLLEIDLVLFEVKVLGPLSFVARGQRVELSAAVGRGQLELLLALAAL